MVDSFLNMHFYMGFLAGFVVVGLACVFWILKRLNAHAQMASKVEHLTVELSETKQALEDKSDQLSELSAIRARLESDLRHEQEQFARELKTVEKAKEELVNVFKAIGKDALQDNTKSFLDFAKQTLEKSTVESAKELEKKQQAIEAALKPVSSSLEKMDEKINLLEKERKGAYEGMRQYLEKMTDDQERLRRETNNLVQALRSPTSKGRWGEIHLRNTVKMAGMIEHVDFVEQDSFRDEGTLKKPDMIVRMPGGQKIIVDAKAPIDAYYDSLRDDVSPEKRDEAMASLAKRVKDHIKGLSSKSYWDQFESPEFVVMFLPNEGCFSAAVEKDPTLLEYGIEHKVIPASPTTLVALLRAVAYGWQQEKITENAREIADLGSELYNRLAVFGDHLQKMGKNLNNALGSYNSAIGSLEGSVLPAARKFETLHVTSKKKELPELKPLEQTTRMVTAPELLGSEPETEGKSKKA